MNSLQPILIFISCLTAPVAQEAGHLPPSSSVIVAEIEQVQSMDPYLSMTEQGGKYITLNDGRKFRVHPSDREVTKSWLGPDDMEVSLSSGDSKYPYLITNKSTGRSVRAIQVNLKSR